jgi:hypothetical protein
MTFDHLIHIKTCFWSIIFSQNRKLTDDNQLLICSWRVLSSTDHALSQGNLFSIYFSIVQIKGEHLKQSVMSILSFENMIFYLWIQLLIVIQHSQNIKVTYYRYSSRNALWTFYVSCIVIYLRQSIHLIIARWIIIISNKIQESLLMY